MTHTKPCPSLVARAREPLSVSRVWIVANAFGTHYGVLPGWDDVDDISYCFPTRERAIRYLRYLKAAMKKDAAAIEDDFQRSWALGIAHGLRVVRMEPYVYASRRQA